jgi:hypothetical protein
MVGFIDENRIWFGNKEYATWIPSPDQGMTRSREGRAFSFRPDNGGQVVDRTFAHANTFGMDFSTQSGATLSAIRAGTWVLHDFASGLHGDGYLYFMDPMTAGANLLGPQWASPALIGMGWKNMVGVEPTITTEPLENRVRNLPMRSANWTLDTSTFSDEVGERREFTLLIPPTHRLWMGAIGDTSNAAAGVIVTGTRSQGIGVISDRNVPLTNESALTGLLPFTDMTIYNYIGDPTDVRADYVTITLGRPNSLSGTNVDLRIRAIYAQILPNGVAPSAYDFTAGRGTSGCQFNGDAIPEEYVMADRTLVSISATLEETEQWSLPA